jgi:hypothetical protein
LSAELERKLAACLRLSPQAGEAAVRSRPAALAPPGDSFTFAWAALLSWLWVHGLGKIVDAEGYAERSRSWIDEWLLGRLLLPALQDSGLGEGEAWRCLALVKVLTSHQRWFEPHDGRAASSREILTRLLADREVQEYLQVNRHQGILWYSAESFEELLAGLRAIAAVDALAEEEEEEEEGLSRLSGRWKALDRIAEAKERSGYQVEKLLEAAARSSPGRREGKSKK